MIETVSAVRFHAAVTSGKTKPVRIECEKSDETTVEVVAKFSAGSERKTIALGMEVVAACLAADLGLPIPQPYLVELTDEFVRSVAEPASRQLMERSNLLAFGSTHVGTGFRAWTAADSISPGMLEAALAIFAFDGFICNTDRRPENPNCLVRAPQLRIFDHELAFTHKMLIGYRQPWTLGGLAPLASPGQHIFYAGLKGRQLELAPIRQGWSAISDERLQQYRSCVPHQWAAAEAVDDAISLIQGVRDNIDAAIAEVGRVLA